MQIAPNCFKCVYFHITHHPKTPRGCSRFGIQTQELPSLSIFFATGKHCPYFYPQDGSTPQPKTPEPQDPRDGWIA